MSDRELRELERQWKRTRAHEDGLAWIRARLRLGLVDPARLEIAALCGLAAARELLPPDRPLLGREQLGELCGVTAATITKWASERECPQVETPPEPGTKPKRGS